MRSPVRVERHTLGPRVFVLGIRVHEVALGLAVVAGALAAALAAGLSIPVEAMGVVGVWLTAKDWHDLFPSRRNTAAWRVGLHRLPGALRRAAWLPRLTAGAAGILGLVNLASALTPNVAWRGHLLLALEPVEAVPILHVLAVPASVLLLVAAFGLARRRRRAWQAAVALLLLLGPLNLLKGLDIEEALLNWAAAGLLWLGRGAFVVRHEPVRLRALVTRATFVAGAVLGISAAAVWAAATPADPGLAPVLRETFDLMLWTNGPLGFRHGLGWVPDAVAAAGLVATVAGAIGLLRPLAPPRLVPGPDVRRAALDLVRRHGRDTLAAFKLRRDLHYFFGHDGRAFAGYRVESGVLLVSGDPVGPTDAVPGLLRELVGLAERHGLRLGAVGASAEVVAHWRALGLRALEIGDEGIVDTRSFSLEGRAIRKVRQSVSRLEKAGYAATLERPTDAELEAVSVLWRDGAAERGFSMALDTPRGGEVVAARDADGVLRGYLHFVHSYGRPAMSLSQMRRDPDTPNGLTEFLVVHAIELLRGRGVEELSLNFAAFARLQHSPSGLLERALGRLVALFNPLFQIESLYRFNAKFDPRWEPRYLVFESPLALPRVGLATLFAEGQLAKPSRVSP